MASSSSAPPPALGPVVSEKLTRDNFVLWRAQILPGIRAAQLMGYLDGTTPMPSPSLEVDKDGKKTFVPNPELSYWLIKDQQLLSYLINSLTKDVLAQVATLPTAAEVWKALNNMFFAQSRARATNLRMQLCTTKKGNSTMAAFFTKMKGIRDELSAAGKVIDDEEMVSHILAGLDQDYNPVVTYIMGRTDDISMTDLFSQLMSYDARLEMFREGQSQPPSVNTASRGAWKLPWPRWWQRPWLRRSRRRSWKLQRLREARRQDKEDPVPDL